MIVSDVARRLRRGALGVLVAALVALATATTASAASLTVTSCTEGPSGYVIGLAGSGFPATAPLQVDWTDTLGSFFNPTSSDGSGNLNPTNVFGAGPAKVTISIQDLNGASLASLTVNGCAPPTPTAKDQCKKDAWQAFDYKNQGRCVSAVASKNK